MSEPLFLSVAEVEAIHSKSIREFGGTLGLRDRHTLEAAVFYPQNVYSYSDDDLFDIAAAYCFHIAEAQAFLDGNKRTAIGAALTFLDGNGIAADFDSSPLYQAMIDLAAKRRLNRTWHYYFVNSREAKCLNKLQRN